ncbi:helix-turn-helix domain-containing protein [Halomonas elongata]|uniref:helix-turn-helix domain-containing protein n=1 Tax=Halomonas elongata TaxID=2746 RepID=UPI00255AD01C|nr:helix-turn-helix domain-containing protein [Halomonas elongata]MDL4861972.1 helix-turn-helix domain-containing protein [Halomonas elongata]
MQITNTSTSSQRSRILARLNEGPATTMELMSELNIMRPGARINELRSEGHDIRTHLQDVLDPWGRPHTRVALYYLPTETEEVA